MKLNLQNKFSITKPCIDTKISFRQKEQGNLAAALNQRDEAVFKNKPKIVLAGTFFDFLRTNKQIQSRESKCKVINDCANKINKYLKEKGFEPCDDFIVSSALLVNVGRKIGGKYLPALEKIVISPKYTDNEKEIEFLVLHEQAHYLHHQKLKALGKSFKPKQLDPEEKSVITDFYKNLLKKNGCCSDKDIAEAIKCYTENNIEFVGYCFSFKNWGINFPEEIETIYKKYDGQ